MLNKKAPCPVCPYKLGMIKAVVNPCPQCKRSNYSFYHKFMQEHGEVRDNKKDR